MIMLEIPELSLNSKGEEEDSPPSTQNSEYPFSKSRLSALRQMASIYWVCHLLSKKWHLKGGP